MVFENDILFFKVIQVSLNTQVVPRLCTSDSIVHLNFNTKSKMHATRWNKKRVITIVVAVLVLYTIFSSGYNKYAVDVTINNAHPESVWEYIADFSKMRLLNPTM